MECRGVAPITAAGGSAGAAAGRVTFDPFPIERVGKSIAGPAPAPVSAGAA